jgi:hypothetical protein
MEISTSLILMQPGMYILRHPKTGADALTVSRGPNGSGKMEVLGTPRTQGAVLRDGADCLAMLITEGPVEILVAGFMAQAGVAPVIKIDQIALDAVAGSAQSANVVDAAKPIEIPATGISIIGHVEKKGDVVAVSGQTLGDPHSASRVEGFQIMWPDRPEGVDLAYSIAVEGVGAMPLTKSGNFCGTRGEAKRITEVTFALVGPNAAKFQLEGSAWFSGGFALPVASGMPLGGPSGVEHLTALSLRAAPKSAGKAANPWNESSRTKVFKAKEVVVEKSKVGGESKKAGTRTAKKVT